MTIHIYEPDERFSGFATLLRAHKGILIGTAVVNKNHLRSHLVELSHVNPSSVESLVDPADKQNVPKAVALIQALDQLNSLDTRSYDPSRMNEHCSLTVIGEVFFAFVNPFIDINMTLSDQLTSLSKYIHAISAIYSKHSTNFMTSALCADSQAIVKDIYFCVAKQKLLNPCANFYIIHCGTDRLEMNFCLARTQSHHRNFDTMDLSNKLATSSLIDDIFLRNPTLDAGLRRLKVTGAIGIDHLNPKSWLGDVNVNRVSLQLCWGDGRKQASSLISSLYPGDPVADFSMAFHSPSCDLLRPGGTYVGFSNETDISIEGNRPGTPVDPTPHPDASFSTAGVADSMESDGDVEIDGDEGEVEDDGDGVDLEELLPDSADEPIDGFDHTTEDWLEIDGQHYLKASLVSQYLKANHSKKMVERTLRVRRLTIEDFKKHPPKVPLDPSGDNFQVGDLAATLVRAGSFVCLTIIQAIGIRKDQYTQHVIKTEALRDPTKGYSVQGEVLRIVQVSPEMWAWPPRDFLKVSKLRKSKHKTSAVRDFTLSISGSRCYPVNPEIHPTPHQLCATDLDPIPLNQRQTWMFCTDDLLNLLQLAWSDFQPEEKKDLDNRLKLLPQVWGPEGFPYSDESGTRLRTMTTLQIQALTMSLGTAAFVVEDFAPKAPDLDPGKETKQECPLCTKQKKPQDMWGHVGGHILLHSRGVEEGGLVNPVSFFPSS